MAHLNTDLQASLDFSLLFDVMPNPCLLINTDDPAFTILGANQMYLQTTGIGKDAIVGRRLSDVFPGNPSNKSANGLSALSASLKRVIDTGKPDSIPAEKYDIRKADGSFDERLWNSVNTPVVDKNGFVTLIIHSVTDVTDITAMQQSVLEARRNEEEAAAKVNHALGAKQATEESLGYLQQVIDKSQTGIFLFKPVKDEDGVVQDFIFRMANDKLASYVGQTKKTVTGSLGSVYFAGYKTNGLFDLYTDTYNTGRQNHFEFHYNTDGVDAWLDIMSTKLDDEVLVTFSDHTSLKQLQQQHEATIEELRRSNSDLEQFAYIASHDLQEPLRKIQAFGEMLKNRYTEQLGDHGVDMIGRMQNASDRMKTLIDDLLTYSRVSSQKRNFKPVDLNKVLQEVLIDLETTLKKEKAIVRIAKLQLVKGDEMQLRQLFQNLISNAIKFKKPDEPPQITVEASVIHASFVKSILLPDIKSNYQHLVVQDNGIGFEPEYSERIFQIFQRLHGRSDYPGTGVGLSIVRKVAEQHKGVVIAEGKPGAGAAFHIYLPVPNEAVNT